MCRLFIRKIEIATLALERLKILSESGSEKPLNCVEPSLTLDQLPFYLQRY